MVPQGEMGAGRATRRSVAGRVPRPSSGVAQSGCRNRLAGGEDSLKGLLAMQAEVVLAGRDMLPGVQYHRARDAAAERVVERGLALARPAGSFGELHLADAMVRILYGPVPAIPVQQLPGRAAIR